MNNNFFKKEKKFILLKDIFNICNQPCRNTFNKKILGVNNIKDANNNEITFFNNSNYEKEAKSSKALACITNEKIAKYLNKNIIPIISKNPLVDFYKVVNLFYPESYIDNEKINLLKNKNQFLKKKYFYRRKLLDWS